MRLVLDTSVLVTAIRAPAGAAARLLTAALRREVDVFLSTPLLLEYEAVMTRPEHLAVAGLSSEDVNRILDAYTLVAHPVQMFFSWRPFLRDSNDEMVLETAVNGQVEAIVTFNARDFAGVHERFGVAVTTPKDIVRRLAQP